MLPTCRYTRALVLVLLLGSTLSGLSADIIYLKNGRELEGFIESAEEIVVIRTSTGLERVRSDEIEKIEVGYSGIALCYKEKSALIETCAGILHRLSPDGVIVGKGRGNTTRKEFSIGDLKEVSFKKQPGQKVIPVLYSGLDITLKTTDGEFSGKIKKRTDGELELELKEGGAKRLQENEIEGGIYSGPALITFEKLIPGYVQWKRGEKIKGLGIVSGLSAMALYGAFEYLQATQANAEAKSAFSFQFFGDPSYKAAFDTHQQNQLYAGVGFGLIYGYHLVDAFWGGSPAAKEKDAKEAPGAAFSLFPERYGRESGLRADLAFTWRF